MRWLILGFVGAFGIGMSGLGLWILAIPPVVLVCLYLAVFYDGLLDPTLAIRRTTVYGTMGLVFLFLFAGLGSLAENWLESSVGLPGSLGTVLIGGTSAVVLVPVKRRMDHFINRILPVTVLAEAPPRSVAVLFSDMVGFTALTGSDENTGLTIMTVFHQAADRVARENNGRFVKAVADEVMLEFEDAIDAVRAATELHDEFKEAAGRLGLPEADICTGIHYGKVKSSRDGDLFGAAVNVASRVQGLAEAGQTVVSGAVQERLKGADVRLGSLGPRTLNNVEEPVMCFEVQEGGELHEDPVDLHHVMPPDAQRPVEPP